jgi:hypothetical protein
LGADDAEDPGEADIGKIGELAREGLDVGEAAEIAGGDAQGFPFPETSEGSQCGGVIGAVDGVIEEGGGFQAEAVEPSRLGQRGRGEADGNPVGFAKQAGGEIPGAAGDADEGFCGLSGNRCEEGGGDRMVLEFRVDVACASRIGGEGPQGALCGQLQEARSVTVVGSEFEVFSFKIQAPGEGTRPSKEFPVGSCQIPVSQISERRRRCSR